LADGSQHQVLKNYFDAAHLQRLFEPRAIELEVRMGKCFWWVSYRVR
jgi:hypothetical protein